MNAGSSEVLARRFVARGRVQGVGYRDYVRRRAAQIGVRGYIRNERDGSVFAYATGTRSQLADFEAALREGSAMADVRRLEIVDCPAEPHPSFSIRR
jgi:acylphosphatase